MKKIFLAGMLMVGFIATAQQETAAVKDSTKHWSIVGQNTLMLNQAAFSYWVGGGANNVGWLEGINYNMTYEKGNYLLENTAILGYGQNNTSGVGNRKTQDLSLIHI